MERLLTINRSERILMLLTDNVSGTYRSRTAVFYFMSSVHNRYVTRLVHRILVFKLDFNLDTQLYRIAA